MQSIHAFILGVVQGITEFFPISSSGHLLAFHDLLHFDQADSLTFDAALHIGTMLALVVYFWKDVVNLVKHFFRSLRHWDVRQDPGQHQVWTVIVGAIPAGIVGVLADNWVEGHVRNLWVVVISLVVGAMVFWVVEAWYRKQQTTSVVPFKAAWVVGLAQIIALIPGISRSGATIIGAFSQKLDRAAAARFAFLVSIPVVAGAGLMKFAHLLKASPTSAEVTNVILGIVSAAIVGYVVIHFFLRFIQKHSLSVFAWYRVAAAAVLTVFLLTR
jgi:undecaprenyl-diphosphatase